MKSIQIACIIVSFGNITQINVAFIDISNLIFLVNRQTQIAVWKGGVI
ncbi:TPA: hypothetical protein NEG48_001972 [Elizabethkingia anophelis]|nr:hypothetical protein [Elizabethkingia anophelis]